MKRSFLKIVWISGFLSSRMYTTSLPKPRHLLEYFFFAVTIVLGEVVVKIFILYKVLTAGCCLSVFYRQSRSRVLQPKKTKSKLLAIWTNAAIGLQPLLLAAKMVSASVCSLKTNAPLHIPYDVIPCSGELDCYIKNKRTKIFPFPRPIAPGHLRFEEKFSENIHFKFHQNNKPVIAGNSKESSIFFYQKVLFRIEGG